MDALGELPVRHAESPRRQGLLAAGAGGSEVRRDVAGGGGGRSAGGPGRGAGRQAGGGGRGVLGGGTRCPGVRGLDRRHATSHATGQERGAHQQLGRPAPGQRAAQAATGRRAPSGEHGAAPRGRACAGGRAARVRGVDRVQHARPQAEARHHRQQQGHRRALALDLRLEVAAARAVAQVAAQRPPAQRAAPQRRQLLADVGAGRVAGRTIGGER